MASGLVDVMLHLAVRSLAVRVGEASANNWLPARAALGSSCLLVRIPERLLVRFSLHRRLMRQRLLGCGARLCLLGIKRRLDRAFRLLGSKLRRRFRSRTLRLRSSSGFGGLSRHQGINRALGLLQSLGLCLLLDLLRCAMTHLSTIFPARCRKITVLRAMQVRPGIKDGYILRRFCRLALFLRLGG